jgi:hypothetical protein
MNSFNRKIAWKNPWKNYFQKNKQTFPSIIEPPTEAKCACFQGNRTSSFPPTVLILLIRLGSIRFSFGSPPNIFLLNVMSSFTQTKAVPGCTASRASWYHLPHSSFPSPSPLFLLLLLLPTSLTSSPTLFRLSLDFSPQAIHFLFGCLEMMDTLYSQGLIDLLAVALGYYICLHMFQCCFCNFNCSFFLFSDIWLSEKIMATQYLKFYATP